MIVQHNMSALNANRQLGITAGSLAKSTEKLSSGYRINRAGDDAAGLAISEKMRGQIRGLDQASANSQDGISLIQTAEGALMETQSILQRMRELAVQAASDTNTDDDREQIQQEISQLTNEVDRIATTTEFNTKKLLDGSKTGAAKEKEGTASAEGTFVNGNVALQNLEDIDLSLVGVDDVIRIEILADTTANAAAIISSGSFTQNSLFGNAGDVTISTGRIIISNALFSDSTATACTDALTILISSFGNLRAGDVITISLSRYVASAEAEDGEEALRLQIGANTGQEMELSIASMKARALNIVRTDTGFEGNALDVTEQNNASMAVEAYDLALNKVSTERAKLGAVQNRLEHTIANLDTSAENLQAAESRIRDADMAKEMTQYSKNNILMQAGQSMLAQANQSTQGVLSLLQ